MSSFSKKAMSQPWYSKKVTSEPNLMDVAVSGLFPGQGAATGVMYLGNKYSEATTPKMPKPPDVAADKSAQQEAARQAAQAEAARIRKRRGMGQTIITGPSGVTEAAPTYRTTLG